MNLRRNFPKISDFAEIIQSKNLSTRCKNDFKVYLNALDNFELWALQCKFVLEVYFWQNWYERKNPNLFKVFDASAKISSGILSGNINSFGDFDECLRTRSRSESISGKYCLAYVNIQVPEEMKLLRNLKKLSHSMETFKGNFSQGFDDVSDWNAHKTDLKLNLLALSLHPGFLIIPLGILSPFVLRSLWLSTSHSESFQ